MSKYFSIRIRNTHEVFDTVSEVFSYVPKDKNADWELIIEEKMNDIDDPLGYLVMLLTDKLSQLDQIGISKEYISLWYLYEYEDQCNMEFSSELLNRIGSLGIDFCISCWEKNNIITL